jgi:glycosyltransferase involved in cell wall biosynthesis
MKRVLFFMPDNPLKKSSGNKTRAIAFLNYFRSRGFSVDFVSEHQWGEWDEETLSEFKESKLADRVYILQRKPNRKNLVAYLLLHKLPEFFYQRKWGIFPLNFPDLVTYKIKKAFKSILKKNEYDYIFINYASWSSLIEDNPLLNKAQTVLDTHDFLTAQYKEKYSIGAAFQEEMRRLSYFDQVLAISVEEQYIFSQFCTTKVSLAPMMIDRPVLSPIPFQDKQFDIIYVASDNPHNITAVNWFMHQVYPLLLSSIRICVIGRITASIKSESYPNITLISFAEDLSPWYQQSKIAICPMLSGTGTKIKVVEALSYSLPVVCNTRGVDGLPNKINNGCLVTDHPEHFAQYITTLVENGEENSAQSMLAKLTFESVNEKENCYKRLDQIFI